MGATCCFFGHRKIDKTLELKERLLSEIENLITNENVTKFLFGSKSQFDDYCYEIVSELKEKYPYLNKLKIISDSDAHYLEKMRLPNQTFDLPDISIDSVINHLK